MLASHRTLPILNKVALRLAIVKQRPNQAINFPSYILEQAFPSVKVKLNGGAVGEPLWRNPYSYADNNPINLVDPSGMTPTVIGGYIEGISGTGALGAGVTGGREVVYDFATFQRSGFTYNGGVVTAGGSVNVSAYIGHVEGFTEDTSRGGFSYNPFNPFRHFISQYGGTFYFEQGGAGLKIPLLPNATGGIIHFHSQDGSVYGNHIYLSGGWTPISIPGVDAGSGITYSEAEEADPNNQFSWEGRYLPNRSSYIRQCQVDRVALSNDILSGKGSPHSTIGVPVLTQLYRIIALAAADVAAMNYNSNHKPCPQLACTEALVLPNSPTLPPIR